MRRGLPFLLLLLAPLAAAPAVAQTLVVRADACAALAAHLPDLGVAYTPGVDVNGRPVAPAEMPAVGGSYFNEVTLQLTVDLRRRLGIKLDPTLFPLGSELGYITVRGNQAYFNGTALAPGADAALASLCRGQGLRWEEPPKR
jgi:hypothetical protein